MRNKLQADSRTDLFTALVRRITALEWKPGAAIPNEADLAREVGVSPGTMRKALDLKASTAAPRTRNIRERPDNQGLGPALHEHPR
jgi:DNA-binding FadR family transcriptional regulator